MSATITLNLKDNSKEGIDAFKKRLRELGVEAKDVDKTFEALNKEFESRDAANAAKDVKKLADALDGTAEAAAELKRREDLLSDALGRSHQAAIGQNAALQQLDASAYKAAKSAGTLADFNRDLAKALDDKKVKQYREEIDRLATAMSGGGKGGGVSPMAFWGATAAGAAVAHKAVQGVGQAFRTASEFSKKMADSGNESFKGLVKSAEEYDSLLVRLGNNRTVTAAVDRTAAAMKGLVPETERFANKALDSSTHLAKVYDYGLKIGATLTGNLELYNRTVVAATKMADEIERQDRVQRLLKKSAEVDAKKAASQAAIKDAADPGAATREEGARQEFLDSLTTQLQAEQQIAILQEERKKRLRQIAKSEGDNAAEKIASDKDLIKNAKDLVDLEKRRLEIMKKETEEAQKLADEALQAQIDQEKKEFEIVLATNRARIDGLNAEWKERQKLQQKAQEASEKDKKSIQQTSGSGAAGNAKPAQPGMGGAGQQRQFTIADQQKIAQQIAKNREQQALDRFKNSKGKIPSGLQSKAKRQARLERMKGFRDARTGKAKPGERDKAIKDLDQKAISDFAGEAEKMLNSGKGLNDTTIQTISRLADVAAKNTEDNSQLNQRVERILEYVNNIMANSGGGPSAKAQAASMPGF